PFVSDNGNPILHLKVSAIADPYELDRMIREAPGVVGTGLFLGMADLVIIEENGKVEIRKRSIGK
ncbi:MAG TPA: ribose-5-phosphate isomerase A, partial [Urbifossiella sp.]